MRELSSSEGSEGESTTGMTCTVIEGFLIFSAKPVGQSLIFIVMKGQN